MTSLGSINLHDLDKCTHLGIGAHPDDLEVMAGHGILECFNSSEKEFVGVICTDGAGSARMGEYASCSDQEMVEIRFKEQEASAKMGQFLAMLQLGHASSTLKEGMNLELLGQLKEVLAKTNPDIIYTHNPMDKHLTHVRVFLHLLAAMREIEFVPKRFLGCEVWRNLDWVPDYKKETLTIQDAPMIQKLIACHKSQIAGGKRYDIAAIGRMKANATFFESHQVDGVENQVFAVDLSSLLKIPKMSIETFVDQYIVDFKNDILKNYK